MSVALAVIWGDESFLGADTQATAWPLEREFVEKIVVLERFAVAICGDAKAADILTDALREVSGTIESIDDAKNLAAFLRKRMDEAGATNSNPESSFPYHPFEILLSTPTEIYEINGMYAVKKHESYAAIGIGKFYALGAVYVTYGRSSAQNVTERGLEAAIFHSPACGGEIQLVKIG